MNEHLGEITVFEKSAGPLTKHIALRDGKIDNDSSNCRMAKGTAWRVKIDTMHALRDLINNFTPNQAYSLGRLKDGLSDHVAVVCKARLNGATNVIARTLDFLVFKEGEPGLLLLDVDLKGMPNDTKRRMEECGGFWGVLCEVFAGAENHRSRRARFDLERIAEHGHR